MVGVASTWPSNRDGYLARGLLLARGSFTYIDPRTHKKVNITARPDALRWRLSRG
jgi:hypothetical protein